MNKSIFRLFLLELEQYWDFPILEIAIFMAVFTLINYDDLDLYFFSYLPMLLILVVGAIMPRSFAGSINSREIVVLLSYPIKRHSLFLIKFIVNFAMIFSTVTIVFLFHIPLLGLRISDPAIYASIITLFIQILFLCATATAISLALRNEVISIITFIFIFLGLEFFLNTPSYPKYLTLGQRSMVTSRYLLDMFSSKAIYKIAFQDFAMALAFPLLTSIILLIAAFIYFKWIMQID